jgi:hypothetical protein
MVHTVFLMLDMIVNYVGYDGELCWKAISRFKRH